MIQEKGEYILKHIGIIKYILNRIQVEEELSIHNLIKLKKNCTTEEHIAQMKIQSTK